MTIAATIPHDHDAIAVAAIEWSTRPASGDGPSLPSAAASLFVTATTWLSEDLSASSRLLRQPLGPEQVLDESDAYLMLRTLRI